MKIVFDYFEDSRGDMDADAIAGEVERIAEMMRDGFTSGELVDGRGRGWWHIEEGES